MDFSRIVLAGCILGAVVVAGFANAGADEGLDPVEMTRTAADAMRQAGLSIVDERVEFSRRGSQNLVLVHDASFQSTVNLFNAYFTNDKTLPGGFRVVARARRGGSANMAYTLRRPDGTYQVVEVMRDGQSAVTRVEGRAFRDVRR